MTAPLSIDCSWPLSPAQTQTENTPCQTEAAQIDSDKKDTEELSFSLFFGEAIREGSPKFLGDQEDRK